MNNFDSLYKKAHEVSTYCELTKDLSSCGGVGSALVTQDGNMYTGLCIDCACSLGFCAEHAAVAEMLKNGESRIIEIIAVAEDGRILPPCGRCRELMYQINPSNRETLVHLPDNETKTLNELLPDVWKAC